MMKKLQYAINPDRVIKRPNRGTGQSAGIDVYIPEFTESFIKELKDKNPNINSIRKELYSYYFVDNAVLLGPGERLLIPSGIHVNLDPNIVQIAFNKSGIASKRGLILGACVIDEDYMGEIHINLINTSNHIVKITSGEKIVQFIELLTYYSKLEELSLDTLYPEVSERGTGGFGSTNNK